MIKYISLLMNWSDWLSLLALLLSSISIGWNINIWRLSQPRIKVEISEGYLLLDPNDHKQKVSIRIINKGDKYIVLHGIFLKSKDNKNLLIENEAKKIEGRNCHTKMVNKEDIINFINIPLIAYATDAVGNNYKSKPFKIDSHIKNNIE